ncbi:hypothetical protein GA0070616_3737 [Micromonospora nigra]|uniref:Uncharacterized protein n=1 Tax=Micromonospora nigra TaxID=145857 RepID=A0A1C6SGM7_9ACTN|nr:hypothetical protein GA0070616_3737 [Micromonospora nigra]
MNFAHSGPTSGAVTGRMPKTVPINLACLGRGRLDASEAWATTVGAIEP